MSTAASSDENVPPADTEKPALEVGTTVPGRRSFSPAEWEGFRSQDKQAASAFVGILIGCYTIGLIIALIVFYSCL